MPLFHVQDSDRPFYIVAKDYSQAEFVWKKIIAKENEISVEDVCSPRGIHFVCDDMELVLNGDHWEQYCMV